MHMYLATLETSNNEFWLLGNCKAQPILEAVSPAMVEILSYHLAMSAAKKKTILASLAP